MGRFQFLEAHFIGSFRYKAGTIVVDTVANKVLGTDVVLPNLSSSTLTPHMRPLDASATTMRNSSPYANVGVPATCTGVASIDA